MMRFWKNVLSQLHSFVLWALLSAVFWGWIFTAFVDDAPAGKKVVIYVDAPVRMERELDARLEDMAALPLEGAAMRNAAFIGHKSSEKFNV